MANPDCISNKTRLVNTPVPIILAMTTAVRVLWEIRLHISWSYRLHNFFATSITESSLAKQNLSFCSFGRLP